MKMNKRIVGLLPLFMLAPVVKAIDHPGITIGKVVPGNYVLVEKGHPISVLTDGMDDKGVLIAADNLRKDFEKVAGRACKPSTDIQNGQVLVGTLKCGFIKDLVKYGKLNVESLKGAHEKYLMTVVKNPKEGVDELLVVVGSDKRGAIYGIYELSEQLGVSPWYDWADVPVMHQEDLSMQKGTYTAGEPAVKYRGLFLNDEAPCLTSWVKHTYGTDYGDHRFYARVFELILRLRGNFMWPAMWGWAFYSDDPENSKTADEMGVIMGTSHHEPMARNHQEWARHRKEYGAWNYQSNQKVLDKFFAEGIDRMKNTEDIVTIGMRGDGDEAMDENANVPLLKRIIKNQRQLIAKHTGKPASKTPQVWALYKEVMDYYDKGLRVPDDVTILLCDDNWGNVRRLPNDSERKHPGGWGMYYHVDYVGAPRNSKWMNVTPIQNMWEQLQLTYEYGVDRLWVLNVGDLKPMEYPISLFMNMAWNPTRYHVDNLLDHTRSFCAQQFGEEEADEAARLLNLSSKYNGRVTAEMLDATTYNVETGEWKQVTDDFLRLEAEALRQYLRLNSDYKDAYKQLILFPIQAMANLYEMYYAQAMNHRCIAANDPRTNEWADRVERAFKRDAALADDYNHVMAHGKWNGMMTQKHIGYTSWNDDFPADKMPEVYRLENTSSASGGYTFSPSEGYIAMEAEHFFTARNAAEAQWTVIPFMGRTLSGVSLMPYLQSTEGASLTYRMELPKQVSKVKVHVITKSTLAFSNQAGHRYTIGFDKNPVQVVNYNAELNEKPENIYSVFYPTVARRVIEKVVELDVPQSSDGIHTLTFAPIEPGVVLEKIVLDWGGYKKSYLFMDESPCKR